MTPYHHDDWLTVYQGDCREVMRQMEPESVHCVVTSPPYWGLRDYGTSTWAGGSDSCDHRLERRAVHVGGRAGNASGTPPGGRKAWTTTYPSECGLCGATRVDFQLGLEATPEEFVANMVDVFREVKRVLRSDGTCWVNLGDSYHGGGSTTRNGQDTSLYLDKSRIQATYTEGMTGRPVKSRDYAGYKPKDLVGIPWAVARALQAPYYTGRMPNEADRRWLAAMIDGEGSINGFHHIREDDGRRRTGVHVCITNSNTALLDEAARIWPASRSEHQRPGAGHLGKLTTWRWLVHGIENKSLILRELYPHLIAKRRQAMLGYNLTLLMADAKRLGHTSQRDEVRDKRRLLVDLMSRANHGEHVDAPGWCIEPPGVTEPGWYLRSDIIWAKPNPMPESVTDRPTKSHEYLFLLTKSARYYYDADAVREEQTGNAHSQGNGSRPKADGSPDGVRSNGSFHANTLETIVPGGRNLRTVWTIATAPYPGAHFATFPPKLVEPCVKAGAPEKVCGECGAGWRRVTENHRRYVVSEGGSHADGSYRVKYSDEPHDVGFAERRGDGDGFSMNKSRWHNFPKTTGWEPTCKHDAETVPATVLDPFAGSGTVGMVAQSLSRRAVLIDLNGDYLVQAMSRNQQSPLGLETA